MVFGNVDCLKKQAEGCGAIKDWSVAFVEIIKMQNEVNEGR